MHDARVSVVVLTHNRPLELGRTLCHLVQLPSRPQIIVVDNHSRGDSVFKVVRHFPGVNLVRCGRNLGAAGRNAGVAQVRTPYVAFCDDDTWWAPDALSLAADLLDAHERLAAVAARILVGPERREDPTCEFMAHSPLSVEGLPGPGLIGFMAGAVVMRVDAYRQVGGYEPRLFIGGEERLMGLDLAARGWHMIYAHHVVTHHHPSTVRNTRLRHALSARNALWIAWLRLPARAAAKESLRALRDAGRHGVMAWALAEAAAGVAWVAARRRVLPEQVEYMRRQVLG